MSIFLANNLAINHNYTKSKNGEYFTFEINSNCLRRNLINQGTIKIGYYITIYANKYQVVEMEYYSEPLDMCRASLVLVR